MTPAVHRLSREEEVLEEIRRFCREELRLARPVAAGDELARDLELDSVSALSLVVTLEDRFEVALGDADAGEVKSVGDLAGLVARRAEARS